MNNKTRLRVKEKKAIIHEDKRQRTNGKRMKPMRTIGATRKVSIDNTTILEGQQL